MSSYLLDSDVLIWHLRGRQDVVKLLERLAVEGELAVSAVSVLEIQAGVKQGEEKRTSAFLEGLNCLAVDRPTAHRAGEYIRTYRAKGRTLDFADSLIAATATLNDLTLVTRNVSHYPMPELKTLNEG